MVTDLVFLALIGVERIAELLLSRRNARLAFARGGVETGARDFRVMTLMHALFLPCCFAECVLRGGRFVWPWALLALAAQGLRWWAIASLGDRWNVRVIVVPGEPAVQRGPYRFVRHPNYAAVAIEMFAVPLAGGAWVCAVLFSAANALVLRARIRAEERALGPAYAQAFDKLPRFVPHG